jgi:phage tail tape-measure protein
MLKLYSFIGATAGSYAGWALGATIGMTTAFIVSMVGTGLGIYAGRRAAHYYGA